MLPDSWWAELAGPPIPAAASSLHAGGAHRPPAAATCAPPPLARLRAAVAQARPPAHPRTPDAGPGRPSAPSTPRRPATRLRGWQLHPEALGAGGLQWARGGPGRVLGRFCGDASGDARPAAYPRRGSEASSPAQLRLPHDPRVRVRVRAPPVGSGPDGPGRGGAERRGRVRLLHSGHSSAGAGPCCRRDAQNRRRAPRAAPPPPRSAMPR